MFLKSSSYAVNSAEWLSSELDLPNVSFLLYQLVALRKPDLGGGNFRLANTTFLSGFLSFFGFLLESFRFQTV